MNRPWYTEGLRFECSQCGGCCTGDPGYVWVTEGEIRNLAAAKSMTVEAYRERYLREARNKLTIRERPNGDCEMLGGTECSVYHVRPVQCKTFPFWPEYLVSRRAWLEAARRCPGMNHGRLYTLDEVETFLRCSSPS